jgi:hypothetical protein
MGQETVVLRLCSAMLILGSGKSGVQRLKRNQRKTKLILSIWGEDQTSTSFYFMKWDRFADGFAGFEIALY